MGPSGAGKSTILAWLAGLASPAFTIEGRALLNGRDLAPLPAEARAMGLLFQDDLLFPHLTVAGNLLFALPRGGSRLERRRVVEAALAEAGLDGLADRDPATLSGGQRARVAVSRALLARPRALLLDEPFSRLDAPLRADFRRSLFQHARIRALPTLLVTHDPADAEAAGGPVIELGDFSGPNASISL